MPEPIFDPTSEQFICRSEELVDGGKGIRFKVSQRGTAPQPLATIAAAATTTRVEADAFLVRFRGKPYAYLNRCGHIPIELDWQAGEFFDFSGQHLICATHGALYGPESGRCLSGRCAGKGLTPVAVIERADGIYWIAANQS